MMVRCRVKNPSKVDSEVMKEAFRLLDVSQFDKGRSVFFSLPESDRAGILFFLFHVLGFAWSQPNAWRAFQELLGLEDHEIGQLKATRFAEFLSEHRLPPVSPYDQDFRGEPGTPYVVDEDDGYCD